MLALALVLVLTPSTGQAVLSDVYLTAVNDQLLDLSSDTMPFYSGGVLYVPSSLFGRELGVYYVRSTTTGLAMLYTTKIDLRFDLEGQLAYDKQGNEYSSHAIERGGIIFFPLDLVCRYFGLNWSFNRTETVPLIRITSDSAILGDIDFLDSAATMMADRYAKYERAVTAAAAPPESSGNPGTPGSADRPGLVVPPADITDPPIQAAEGQKVYLLVSSRSTEDTLAVLERLGGTPATFLLTADRMEDGDLLRGLVAGGHAVALHITGETEEEALLDLERARELLWQSACSWLDLVWYEGGADLTPLLADWGCVRVSGTLSETSLRSASQANSLLRRIGQYREDLGVYLGSDGSCAAGLDTLLDGLEEGQYRLCAWRLTA